MRILFATAELAPLATVGGLASAAAGLGRELRVAGVDVDLVMPDYGGVSLVDERTTDLVVPDWVGAATARTGHHPDVGALTLLGVPDLARPHPYLQPDGQGWPDNSTRFFRFAAAVAAWCEHTGPDVLHLNDWHTGPALAALSDPPPTVVSIHNLAYQGIADGSWLDMIGPQAEHFEWWGGTNPLSGALALADRVVAVSPNYAGEITTPAGGFGLDRPLAQRGDALVGILNGIDTEVWNPATDPHLPATFHRGDLDGKSVCRSALVERLGLPDDDVPLATVVTRLTDQKGIDLLLPLVELFADIPLRLGVLGSGDAVLAAELRRLADAHPEHLSFVEGYDEALSHLMFAGADAFLMPSRFEPCGLTQMQAMRYGTLPIVTAVGGLVDTVPDADDAKDGLGIVAARVDTAHLLAAMFRAARLLGSKRRRNAVRRRMMKIDWSWTQPAERYRALYETMIDERRDSSHGE
ncbi:MAG: glycogen/starch synthase [Actinomycetota bacterium]